MPEPIRGMRVQNQWFPFGRGDRGSRQRVVVSFENWQGLMKLHAFNVSVKQVVGLEVMIFRIGFSSLNQDFKPVFQARPRDMMREAFKAIKFFPVVRRNNKIIRAARKRGGNGEP